MNRAMATLSKLAYNSNVFLNQYSLFKIELLHFYMKSCYSRILIGSFLISITGQTTIDVIITKFFPLCFEMAESFASSDEQILS